MTHPAADKSQVGVLLVALAGALVVLLWPLHANGVSGTALLPRYHDFGWVAYDGPSLPADRPLTLDDLRHAGVRVPQDVVERRRRIAAVEFAAVLVVVLGWSEADQRRRGSTSRS
jgi:hypothetical protein